MSDMSNQMVEELLVLLKLWHGNYMEALGETLITVSSQHMGTAQLSIRNIQLMTAEEALGTMEGMTNESSKKTH